LDTIGSVIDLMSRRWGSGVPVQDVRTIPQQIALASLEEANTAARTMGG
jgi:hypothetical protein